MFSLFFFFNLTRDRVIWEEAMEEMPPSECLLSKSAHHFLLVHRVREAITSEQQANWPWVVTKLQAEQVTENKLVTSAPLRSLLEFPP